MEINMQECRTRIDTLSKLESEVHARNSTISILLNIINAFLAVHKLEPAEIEVLQKALEQENNYTQELTQLLAANLGIITPEIKESAEGNN